jgi:hypothetical protein
MHDPANGLLRILLPRTPVNNGKKGNATSYATCSFPTTFLFEQP